MAYYNNKLLHKWLEVRGFTKECRRVNDIYSSSTEREILASLIEIFKIDEDTVSIQDYLDKVLFEQQRDLLKEQRAIGASSERSFLRNYFDEYDRSCQQIFINSNDRSIIQRAIENIVVNYQIALQHCYYHLYHNASTLALLCLLINPFTRKFFFQDTNESVIKPDLAQCLIDRLCPELLKKCKAVKVFSKKTGSDFQLVTEKDCLVIRIDQPDKFTICAVTEAQSSDMGVLHDGQINGRYRIFRGLKIKNTSLYNSNKVYYIEI